MEGSYDVLEYAFDHDAVVRSGEPGTFDVEGDCIGNDWPSAYHHVHQICNDCLKLSDFDCIP